MLSAAGPAAMQACHSDQARRTMRIELTDKELRNLIKVLEARLRELRYEIVHTSAHEFKHQLRDDELVLQCLHDKLVTMDALNVA
jgi:hypothetical protein